MLFFVTYNIIVNQQRADDVVRVLLDSLRRDREQSVRRTAALLGRPVLRALGSPAFCRTRRHHDHERALLPHHPPEVTRCLGQRTCRTDKSLKITFPDFIRFSNTIFYISRLAE